MGVRVNLPTGTLTNSISFRTAGEPLEPSVQVVSNEVLLRLPLGAVVVPLAKVTAEIFVTAPTVLASKFSLDLLVASTVTVQSVKLTAATAVAKSEGSTEAPAFVTAPVSLVSAPTVTL